MKLLLISALVVFSHAYAFCQWGQWQKIADMTDARSGFAASRIGNKIYFCGGNSGGVVTTSCEIFDLTTHTFSLIASLNEPRLATPSVALPDGKLYLPSGISDLISLMTPTCEIYDPITNTWTYTTNLLEARESEATILLNDSMVLIVAGALAPNGPYRNTCELFNINSKQVTFTGSLSIGQFAGPIFLDSARNKVIYMGGHYNGQHGTWVKRTEEYDIASGTWTVVANSLEEHGGGNRPVVLPNGDIIVAGGDQDPKGADYAATDLIEIYTPSTYTWRTFGRLRIRRLNAATAYIGGDSILVVGGYEPVSGRVLDDCEIINIKTGAVTVGPKLNQARVGHWITTVRTPDPEDPCVEYYRVYVFAGETSLFSGTVKSCELIEFRREKQTVLNIPDSFVFRGNLCETIDTTITLGISVCRQMTVDSVVVEGLPFVKASATYPVAFSNDTTYSIRITARDSIASNLGGFIRIFYRDGILRRDTLIPIHIVFQGVSTTLAVPRTLLYRGTVCDGIDTSLTVGSNSCFDLTIDSIQLSGIPYSSISATTPMILKGGTSVTLPIAIHTTTSGISNGTVHIWYHSGGIAHDTTIFITTDLSPSTRGVVRALLKDVLDAGDTVEIPLFLNSNTGELIDGFELSLRYNTDLLTALDPIFTGTLCEGAGLFDLNRLQRGNDLYVPYPFALSTAKPLVILRFVTYVTKTNCTAVSLDKLRLAPDDPLFGNCLLAVSNDSAIVCRVDACGDKTIRAFMNRQFPPEITSAHFDAAKNTLAVVHTFEAGEAEVEVYTTLGTLALKRKLHLSEGPVSLSAKHLGIGPQYIVIKKNGTLATRRVLILR